MPINRFFLEDPLERGAIISLKEGEHHHLRVVVKGKQGDRVELINGKGSLADAEVLAIGKHESTLSILSATTTAPPKKRLSLALALIRGAKLDLVLEKGTELGVEEFLLFPAEKSERDQFPGHERTMAVLIAALKQSGRLFLPKVVQLSSLQDLKKKETPLFFGDLAPKAEKFSHRLEKGKGCCFIIGPESGFTDSEIAKLRKFATGVSLNDAILRTETASIAAAAIAAELL